MPAAWPWAAAIPVAALAATRVTAPDAELLGVGVQFEDAISKYESALDRVDELTAALDEAWLKKPEGLFVRPSDGWMAARAMHFRGQAFYLDDAIEKIQASADEHPLNVHERRRLDEIKTAHRQWTEGYAEARESMGINRAEAWQMECYGAVTNLIDRGSVIPATTVAGLAVKVRLFEWLYVPDDDLEPEDTLRLASLLADIKSLAVV